MLRNQSLFVSVLAVSGLVALLMPAMPSFAQNLTQINATAAQINNTPIATRTAWCQQQVSMCSTVCAFQVTANTCNTNTLQYACACTNGTQVNFGQDVDLTIPFFGCITYDWQPCISACAAGDQACQDNCNTKYVCGKVKANPNATVGVAPTTSAQASPTFAIRDNILTNAGDKFDLINSIAAGVAAVGVFLGGL